MSDNTIMIMVRRILSERNLIQRKHFSVSFFVAAIKVNSSTTLACYTIGWTIKICQVNGLRGGQIVSQCFSPFSENVFHQVGLIVRIPKVT